MKTETIFREIDSLISVTEAIQRDFSDSIFDRLRIVEEELTFFRLHNIEDWIDGKSASLFQFARFISKRAEKLTESYAGFINPASVTAGR